MRVLLAAVLLLLAGCVVSPSEPPPGATPQPPSATPASSAAPQHSSPAPLPSTWDATTPIPSFVHASPIDPASLERVSRFRSGVGHDYADGVESCRSLKHYFFPRGGGPSQPDAVPWTSLPIFSPIHGTVTRLMPEWVGVQVHIQATEAPAFFVRLFHVAPREGLELGTVVQAGERIGNHSSEQTMSDAAIEARTKDGFRFVSLFDAMDDEAFEAWRAAGVGSRADLVIPREERDAAPLSCDGERFLADGGERDWFVLS